MSNFKKYSSCDPIRSMNEYIMEKYQGIYTAFLFMGDAFWKENIEDRVKLLGSNVF